MCLKSALACNIAIDHAKNVVKSGFSDKTSPSVWTPYRLPYNPGGYQYGSLSKYQWVK